MAHRALGRSGSGCSCVVDPSYDFAGRHVVVTGGSSGLGLHLAHAFADAGARVTVTGTQDLTGYYDADLGRFAYEPLRLTDRDSIARAADGIGALDVLVNNAPPQLPPSSDPGERQFLQDATRLGLIGPLALSRRLRFRLGQSTQRGGGVVLNAPGTEAWFELVHGLRAREELADQTRVVATDWAREGVRVTAVTAQPLVPQQSVLKVQIDRHWGRCSPGPVRPGPGPSATSATWCCSWPARAPRP